MKSILNVLLLAIACNVLANTSSQVMKVTAVKVKYSNIYFSTSEGKLKDNNLVYGSRVYLYIQGLSGLSEKDGNSELDISISATDEKGKEIAKLDSILEGEYPASQIAQMLKLYFQCQAPLKVNKSYTLTFTVKDKNGEGKLIVSQQFTMNPIAGLTFKNKGMNCDGAFVYLKDADEAILINEFPNTEFFLYITGTKGMKEIEGKSALEATIRWYDKKGNLIESFFDLFGKQEYDAQTITELLKFNFKLPPEIKKGTYKVEYEIKDRNSDKYMTYTFTFKVKK